MFGEPPPPFSYGVGRSAHPQADVFVLRAFCRLQHDAPVGPAPARSCAATPRLSSLRRSFGVKSIAIAVLPTAKILRADCDAGKGGGRNGRPDPSPARALHSILCAMRRTSLSQPLKHLLTLRDRLAILTPMYRLTKPTESQTYERRIVCHRTECTLDHLLTPPAKADALR